MRVKELEDLGEMKNIQQYTYEVEPFLLDRLNSIYFTHVILLCMLGAPAAEQVEAA